MQGGIRDVWQMLLNVNINRRLASWGRTVEVLIHIGIDTVELEGKYFESFIKQGECVQVGQKLISFDRQKIKEKGYDDTVVMIVTNSDNYLDIIPSQEKNVTYDETCLTVVLA